MSPRLDPIGNAERLHALVRHQLRYVPETHKFLVYDDHEGRWREDHGEVVALEWAKGIVVELLDEAMHATDEERKRILAWATRSAGSGALRGALELVRGMPGIAVSPAGLDSDPDLLNTPGGTIDLTTGNVRPHDPDDLITRSTVGRIRPDADAPMWRAFLERVQPDPDMRAYLQRAVGASLCGRCADHVLQLLLGPGANGKTVFVRAIHQTLGDYAGVAPKDLLVATRHGQHSSSRVAIEGRRFVSASEVERGSMLAEAEVKELTGGDRLLVRRLYGEAYEVEATANIWLSANERPRVRGTDEGIWRRMRLVDFGVTIPAHERDTRLSERLAEEVHGILAWAVEGHLEWLRIGLAEPASVVVATEGYRASEDVVGRFLADNDLVIDADDASITIANTDLGKLRETWCEETGERLSARALGLDLPRRGAVATRTGRARGWRHFGRRVTRDDGTDGSPESLPYTPARGDFPGEAS